MSLAHVRRGSGEPLVLVHGTGSQRQLWDPVLERLAAQRDVVALDLPGHGESAAAREASISPERYADAVEGLLDELALGRVHVAGNSLGGGIALVLGARGRALSVTTLSPIGFWTPREAEFCRHSIHFSVAAVRALNPVAPLIFGHSLGRTLSLSHVMARPWRMSAEESIGATRNLARINVRPATDGYRHWRFVASGPLPCPVTIAWGERDRLLLPRQAERARRAVPGARVVMLAGCGHMPTWDDPELVAGVLLEGSASAAAATRNS